MLKRILAFVLLVAGGEEILRAQPDDRWRIPDSALAIVARELESAPGGGPAASAAGSLLANAGCAERVAMRAFGRIAALGSPAHLSPCRFHEPGKSIGEELRSLQAGELRGAIETALAAAGRGERIPSLALTDRNVVVNYLLHHLVALHLSDRSRSVPDQRDTLLKRGLEVEGIAQGFLVDAFSPGHMRVPMWGILRWLHTANTREAHDFYSSQGLFVMNSRGEVWQAFGDQVTQWHAPTWEHVLDACCSSLRELFQEDSSRLLIEGGDFYYERLRLPTLMALPFPVSATWSVRTEEDPYGRRIRRHAPQIGGNVNFADPDLPGPSSRMLYAWDALPPWLLPDAWIPGRPDGSLSVRELSAEQRRGLVMDLIRMETLVASVRYFQELNYPPSYSGVHVAFGGGWLPGAIYPAGIATGILGYSPRWKFLPDLLVKLRVSGTVAGSMFFDRSGRGMVSGRVGLTVPFSLFGLSPDSPVAVVHGFRVEGGHTEGLGSLAGSRGGVVTLGLESATIPLGFTYLGIVLRPRLDVYYMKERIMTLTVEMIVI